MDSLLSSLLTTYEEASGGGVEAPAPEEPPEIRLPEPVRSLRQPVTCKYVAVSLGWHKFAVPVESVVEAGRLPRTTLAPGLPTCVRGVFSFRGEVLPVIDMHVMAGEEAAANPSESRILTIQSADRQTKAAFAFDTLEGIVNLDPEPGGRVEPEHPLAALLAAVSHNDSRESFGLLAVDRLFQQAGFSE